MISRGGGGGRRMKVDYKQIKNEHKTLLLVPRCECDLCLILLRKWLLVRALAPSLSQQQHITIRIMELLIEVLSDRYERQEEIRLWLSVPGNFYRKGIHDPSSPVYRLQKKVRGGENDFINRAFLLPSITTLTNRELSQTLKDWKRPKMGNYLEFRKSITYLMNEAITTEQRMNHYIMKSVRPYHNQFVCFQSVQRFSQLRPSIHDMQAFVTSNLFQNHTQNLKVRDIITHINMLYNCILPQYREKLMNRESIKEYTERLFLFHFCCYCKRFGYSESLCYCTKSRK